MTANRTTASAVAARKRQRLEGQRHAARDLDGLAGLATAVLAVAGAKLTATLPLGSRVTVSPGWHCGQPGPPGPVAAVGLIRAGTAARGWR